MKEKISKEKKNEIIEICEELLDENNEKVLKKIIFDLNKEEKNTNIRNRKIKNIFYIFAMCFIGMAIILQIFLSYCKSVNIVFILLIMISILFLLIGSCLNFEEYEEKKYLKIYSERNNKVEKITICNYCIYRINLKIIKYIENIKLIKLFYFILKKEQAVYTLLIVSLTIFMEIILLDKIKAVIIVINLCFSLFIMFLKLIFSKNIVMTNFIKEVANFKKNEAMINESKGEEKNGNKS